MKARLLYNSTVLKITACAIGYGLWVIASSSHMIDRWLTVPVCFYNTQHDITINAPEDMRIHVRGERAALQRLNTANLAAHIDATNLHEGDTKVRITASLFFMPPSVHIIEHTPMSIDVHVTKDAQQPALCS